MVLHLSAPRQERHFHLACKFLALDTPRPEVTSTPFDIETRRKTYLWLPPCSFFFFLFWEEYNYLLTSRSACYEEAPEVSHGSLSRGAVHHSWPSWKTNSNGGATRAVNHRGLAGSTSSSVADTQLYPTSLDATLYTHGQNKLKK